MSQKIRKSSQIARRYAESLLDLAEDKPGLEVVSRDFQGLLDILNGSQDLTRAISDPRIKISEKKAVLEDIVSRAKYHDIVTKFIATVAENERLPALPVFIEAVLEQVKTRRGIVDAHLVVANDLGKTEEENLKKSIVKSMGSNVNLSIKKDESLLGGLVLTVGSLRIDDSVSSKLQRLERQMISGQNSKIQEVA